jgi:hypothetical protein
LDIVSLLSAYTLFTKCRVDSLLGTGDLNNPEFKCLLLLNAFRASFHPPNQEMVDCKEVRCHMNDTTILCDHVNTLF